MKDCVFCKIIKREIESHFIWEDKNFFVFLDLNPVNPGHILIIPKKHIKNIFDLDDSMYKKIFQVAKYLSEPLRKATKSKRVGIVIEGFGVDHVHLHLVPVNSGGELDPNRAKKASIKELQTMSNQIIKQL